MSNPYKHLLKDVATILTKYNETQQLPDHGDMLNLALSYSIATYNPESDNSILEQLKDK